MTDDRLMQELESGDPEIAMEAAKVIVGKRLKVPISRIEKIVSRANPAEWSRIAGIYVLGNLRIRKSAPLLASILADEHEKPIFREYAAEALGNIGDTGSLSTISSIARTTTSPEIRRSCEFALEEINAVAARESDQSS
jgi:HEAT repeat protein